MTEQKRYVYVVTRYTYDEPEFSHAIPNLGVHKRKYKAIEHFESVLKDREQRCTVYWDIIPDPGPERYRGRCIVMREALIDNGREGKENLRLERWQL